MNLVNKIKLLLKEAELFHSQGLLDEAMGKYNEATELINSDEQLKSKKTLIHGISNKIKTLKKDLTKVHDAPKKPEVSSKVQDLIKKMFLFSAERDEDTIALDGAIALAKFGQYNKAIKEFNELLKKDSLRVVAAKNILRCHMALASAEDAIAQYKQWHAGDIFNKNQLDKLGVFFENILEKEGIDKTLFQPEASADDLELLIKESVIDEPVTEESLTVEPLVDEPVIPEPVLDESLTLDSVIDEPVIEQAEIAEPVLDESLTLESVIEEPVIEEPVIEEPVIEESVIPEPVIEVEEVQEDDVIDINGIGITIDSGHKKGEIVELDVSFQSKNVISLLISQRNKYLIEDLEVGDTLNDIQFYSPIAMFTGSCVVTAISQIKSGPRQGDYSLDLRVKSS
jgi:hypothetical protein